MALLGGHRDVSFIKKINRELLGDIITQQCAIYKINLKETQIDDLYGESNTRKSYLNPVLLNCLISREDQNYSIDDSLINSGLNIEFRFFREDLVEANIVPEVGDIILYEEAYYEIDETNSNQYFLGKNPDYPNEVNPLNPNLDKFGHNISIICKTHYVPIDKIGINNIRL